MNTARTRTDATHTAAAHTDSSEQALERMRRWRLVLGGADDGTGVSLQGDDGRIDVALGALYDTPPSTGGRSGRRRGGLGGRWWFAGLGLGATEGGC